MDNFTNFAKSHLASGITSGATSLSVATGDGAKFPAQPFNATIWNSSDYFDPSDDPNREIVRVTAVSTDTFTISRAQEGTAAVAHNAAGKTYGLLATLTAKTVVELATTIESDVSMLGDLIATDIAAPATPSAGKTRVYVDSTSKNIAAKNDAGTVNHGVQTKPAVSHNFLTAVADDGTVSSAQPADADIEFADVTTGDVSAAEHGFAKKLPNDATLYYNGQGNFVVPSPNLAALSPDNFAGLILWLKADAGAYHDAGVTLATNGQAVQQWNDQSGNGRNVAQATGGKQPLYVTGVHNGLPVIRFSGGQCLIVAAVPLSSLSVLCVCSHGDSVGMVYEHSAQVGANDGSNLIGNQPMAQTRRGGLLASRNAPDAVNWSQWDVFGIYGNHCTGPFSEFYLIFNGRHVGGTASSAVDNTMTTVTDALNIGARNNAGSLAMIGDIAEFMIFSPALTIVQELAVIEYLRNRWNTP